MKSVAKMGHVRRSLSNRLPQPWQDRLRRHRLLLAIGCAIVIALIQTVVSVSLYVHSSTYGLDLSRPEFERAKREVRPNTPQAVFDSAGPVNPQTIDQFMKLYGEQEKSLEHSDRYDGTPLGDDELRFTPDTSGSTGQ